MVKTIKYGSEAISYSVEFTERKTLGISVYPDRATIVKAPIDSSMEKIEQKVRKKAAWILKQQDYFLSFEPRTTPRKFVSGETHLYLGRQYQLKVIIDTNEFVKYTGRFIEVHTSNKNSVSDLLNTWYSEKAKIWFPVLAEPLINRFKKYGVVPKTIDIKAMQYRWGSCSAKGRILLNLELMKAPKACIQYVIVHELCHLVHRDHTAAFFKLQDREFSEWKKWKEKLEKLLA